MVHSDHVLTETYRDKRYEEDLTKLFFRVLHDLSEARKTPAIEYLKMAYSSASEFCQAVVFSKEHLVRYRAKVSPVLDGIQLILYGDHRLPSVRKVAIDLGVNMVRQNGRDELEGGPIVVRQLDNVIFLVKQWAYEEGLFLPKPIDRKYGTDAISETLEQ